ncbi:HWE histidine kinase domain-containing protein, partial [Loktanella sp. S4079]|uniref:HWE histidine kinase domain-containing protein n=1 Tax=Loktanella sp. S4079 TaxID=579483 RepID=UPI0005FA79EC
IAEKCASNMEPYLGLRYPASDIPQQARALYKRSLLRLIADVDGEISPIIPSSSPSGEPLDLSLAVTRSVSPIHLEYLRNMNVGASMSVSILKDGELWGLFACHHNSPHYVDYERRTAIELFAQFFSYELLQKSEQQIRKEEYQSRQMHDHLMVKLSSGEDLYEGFETLADELAEIIECNGLAVYSGGRFIARGMTPTREEFLGLARFLNTVPTAQIYATENLASIYPAADSFTDRATGVLAVPISRTPRDYIVFFRQEMVKSVKWAGNPEKPVSLGPNGARLTPRKSFAAWQEVVRGTSAAWTKSDKRSAEALRVSLIEVVLKLSDEANLERRKAAEKQELLIAELNHRVRNILNLIRGLVSQSKSGATDMSSYTELLDGRIQSLARAHDQLTREEWSPSPLRELIDVEVNAFIRDDSGAMIVNGDNPMLSPEAFSTMALVIHELVTNSAKYGALKSRSGTVAVDLDIDGDGSLKLTWKESGGPAVKAPTRRGFGTTIIEKTIPHELKGTVSTRYLVTGFEAEIMIPSSHITAGSLSPKVRDDTVATTESTAPKHLLGEVLVVDDNMIIALDACDILSDFGATETHMAGTVEDALDVIKHGNIAFAVLDVNLGSQTSLPIAQKLLEQNIPFVLATGYGDTEAIINAYPPAHIVKKPFTAETLLREVNAT